MHSRLGRLAVVFATLALLTAAVVPSALAAPSFTYHVDDDGANDEPGQKDLTAQSADDDAGTFYTSWKWDETSFSGKNTGDGCSLFDTGTLNGLTNYALCGTVGGGVGNATVQLLSFRLYACSDGRADRCTNPTELVGKVGADAATFCSIIDSDTGAFGGTDTTIVCNISAIAAEADPPITVFGSGTLLNTCSYPSREPNSDPSDCVVTIPAADTTTVTTPSGSATFTATLNDSAQVTPAAAGNVAFELFSDSTCATSVFSATSATNAAGVATTSTTVSVAGTYYWTADFTPTDPGAYNPSASACGSEVVTVTAPGVN